ncbi:MAG: efflux RND transporter periplasmic adaptor subunit [Bryobacteraceae bacterium]
MKIARVFIVMILLAAAFFGGLYYERFRTPTEATAERKPLYYVDPMHPAYKSDKPGIAPDCGMKLEAVYADSARPGGGVPSSAEFGAPPDLAPNAIQVSTEKQQLIGVRYGTVEMASASSTLRTVGKVALDETRVARVHSKITGWIDKVYVDFTGSMVKVGQPLMTVYSPEMLASQQEYLLALRSREIMYHSSVREASINTTELIDAAKKRLELWDFTPAQIEELQKTNTPIRNITIFSPADGTVLERGAFPGQRIAPETQLYSIANLDRVWVIADVYEADMDKIRIGQKATIIMPSANARSFTGTVDFIQPQVDATTRTLKIRLNAMNPNQQLKPDMFVNVDFYTGSPVRMSIPADAVLDSGMTKTVFVDRGNGYLEPRVVQTGERSGDSIQILSGLKPGERIVTSGTFLIDSESRLRNPGQATSGQGTAGHQHGAAPSQTTPAEHQHAAPPAGANDHSAHTPSGHENHDQPAH